MSFHFKRLDYKNKCSIIIFELLFCLIFLFIHKKSFALSSVTLLTPPSPGEFYFTVAREVFNESGLKVNIEVETFPKIFRTMNSTNHNSKKIYATVAILNEKNSAKYINIGNILSVKTSFFTLKDSKQSADTIEQVKSLNGVCVWLDSILNKYLVNKGFNNLVPGPTFSHCTDMLYSGKVDAFFTSEATLIKTARANKLDLSKIKRGYSPMTVTFFLAVTKNASKEHVKKLRNSNKQYKQNGKYDAVLNKYRNDLFLP